MCIIIILCGYFLQTLKAQDKLIKTDYSIIEVKVTEITDVDVLYKKFSNPDGPVYSIKKTEVLAINYQNGEKEVFTQAPPKEEAKPTETVSKPAETQTIVVNDKDDCIVTTKGEIIMCKIDRIELTKIFYHLQRHGADPDFQIPLAQVTKYCYRKQWTVR